MATWLVIAVAVALIATLALIVGVLTVVMGRVNRTSEQDAVVEDPFSNESSFLPARGSQAGPDGDEHTTSSPGTDDFLDDDEHLHDGPDDDTAPWLDERSGWEEDVPDFRPRDD